MARLQLPAKLDHKSYLRALEKAHFLVSTWTDITFQLAPKTRLFPSGVVALGSWVLRNLANGKRIKIDIPNELPLVEKVLRSRALLDAGNGSSEPVENQWVPLQKISNDDDLFQTVNLICDLVLKNVPNAKNLLPIVEWCCNEIFDNILRHSGSEIPGCVCAMFDPRSGRFDVAAADCGRGVLDSIREAYQPFNNAEAIKLAITKGVTRDPKVGQGFGLAGNVEILDLNGGAFQLTSGDIRFEMERGSESFTATPDTPGTQVYLSFDTQNPIPLEKATIVGASTAFDWNYFDIIEEKISQGHAFKIIDECIHFGGRGPAKALRLKLESILQHSDIQVTVDFVGIGTPASSFLDELLGRLASTLGPSQFKDRVKIKNMSELIEKMAATVINDRLKKDNKI